jgi:S1-C subfamily serine protease
LFSGAHADYHQPTDTPDKVSGEGLAKVAAVSREAIEYLAGNQANLTRSGGQAAGSPVTDKPARRAGLGTVPDFAYAGEGVRLSGINPGSPAQAAGLREGDILTDINDRTVNNLKEYADVLRTLAPGDAVRIRFLRDGEPGQGRPSRVEADVVQVEHVPHRRDVRYVGTAETFPDAA